MGYIVVAWSEHISHLLFRSRCNLPSQADASLGMLEREYLHESLSYVLAIQDVQERIKFEFVETLLGFMSGWMVFYHWGHDTAVEAREYMTDLQHKVQKVSGVVVLCCP